MQDPKAAYGNINVQRASALTDTGDTDTVPLMWLVEVKVRNCL